MKAHVSNGCKPCPFCGAPVTVRLMRKGPDFIACTNKQECGAIFSFNNTPCDCFGASPVDYFNRRASAEEIALVEDAPAVVPDVQRWRDPDKDPPKVEEEVLILFETACGGYGITTAHYEDGTLLSQDSIFYWDELAAWGELVADPFAGLFTVPYEAVKMNRKGKGVELNPDYFRDGVGYLETADAEKDAPTLFDLLENGA